MLVAQGIDIKRAILAFWVGYAAAELKPLYLRLRELRTCKRHFKNLAAARVREWLISPDAAAAERAVQLIA
jgi:hypothetical protein